jgi:hypothetical protein
VPSTNETPGELEAGDLVLSGMPRNISPMTRHRRRAALAGVLAVVLAACGGGEAADPTGAAPTTGPAREAAPETSTGSGGSTAATAPATTTAVDPDAAVAPDFTLELGTGGEFALSKEAKPVYMVFWAEW